MKLLPTDICFVKEVTVHRHATAQGYFYSMVYVMGVWEQAHAPCLLAPK